MTRTSFRSGVAGALIVLCSTIFAVNYRVETPSLRTVGPTWAVGLAEARQECADSASGHEVAIPIAPVQYWTFTLDCERIED